MFKNMENKLVKDEHVQKKICNLDDLEAVIYGDTDIELNPKLSKYDSVCNTIALSALFTALNEQQEAVAIGILNFLLDSRSNISLLDAPPGTGKTFLTLGILMCVRSYDENVKNGLYLGFSNELVFANNRNTCYESKTICSFLMKQTNLPFYKYCQFTKTMDMVNFEKHLQNTIPRKINLAPLILVDEYTVLSPLILYIFIYYSVYTKAKIIFIGDHNQLPTITQTNMHARSNMKLLLGITRPCYVFQLNKNVRQITDIVYGEKLKELSKYCRLRFGENANMIKMDFAIKYKIYTLFRKQFHAKPNYRNIYLSSYHRQIKNRYLEMLEYLKINKIDHTILFPLGYMEDDDLKFNMALVLVKGWPLCLYGSKRERIWVNFVEIKDDKTIIVETKDGKKIEVVRIAVYNFYHKELLKLIGTYRNCTQFPLSNPCFSYHSVQGLTIKDECLDLNMDTPIYNGVYVGITRACDESQLNNFSTKEKINLYVTREKDDEYFYKIDPNDFGVRNTLDYKQVKSLPGFEIGKNVKILKSIYEKIMTNDNESEDTPLITKAKALLSKTIVSQPNINCNCIFCVPLEKKNKQNKV